MSRATLKRDLQYLRERLDAPIVYDRLDNAYRFGGSTRGRAHELPGLWFSDKEIHALLTMHQLIQGLEAEGVLGRHLQPLLDKLHGMLGSNDVAARELMQRVNIVAAARRPVNARFFELIGSALLERRRVELLYFTRGRGSESRREVSPQRLTHYRNTWYLDAWCHRSEGLRRFALDAVRDATVLAQRAKEVPLATVKAELDGGYGVFAGRRLKWAMLHFSAEAAQWVATEQWHPQQQHALAGRWQPAAAPALCRQHRTQHGHPAPRRPGARAGAEGPGRAGGRAAAPRGAAVRAGAFSNAAGAARGG